MTLRHILDISFAKSVDIAQCKERENFLAASEAENIKGEFRLSFASTPAVVELRRPERVNEVGLKEVEV